ncbi:MAG TPA: hypothetical protein VK815_16380 [Candidatus Acidoferrales bacterium]|jgi:hypothetical protein|nr:hypothetical protein [Candidatus Acidoferrales bacterium]
MSATGVQFELVERDELTSVQKGEMLQLLTQHFDGVTHEQFARDLAEKNLALLLRRENRLVGFSTQLAYTTTFEGGPVNVIYSGDTIVSPEAWGTTALPRAWVAGVEALRATLPPGRCFWLLLTSGFRTYRFLPVFWREFFPRFDMPTPPETRRLIDQLARERFGNQFDARAGVVRFNQPQRLRAGLEEIPPGREQDPHTAFFLAHNPGHASGDELACLTELCPENLTAAGRRMMPIRTHELASLPR